MDKETKDAVSENANANSEEADKKVKNEATEVKKVEEVKETEEVQKSEKAEESQKAEKAEDNTEKTETPKETETKTDPKYVEKMKEQKKKTAIPASTLLSTIAIVVSIASIGYGFYTSDNPQIQKAITYFEKDSGFSYENLITIFKSNYVDECIRIVNNTSVNENIVKELNELEKNSIRVIFAVNMLNEGWDVLNLFDIVRLDETNSGKKDTVISDKQLIGRGCRIFPFNVVGKEKYKRKFDYNLDDDLRVLEEFYYHSKNNDKFINSLKDNLVKE